MSILMIKCIECKTEIEWVSCHPNQRYCKSCSESKRKSRVKKQNDKRKAERRSRKNTQACQKCNFIFISNNKARKFCSDLCRWQHWSKKTEIKRLEAKIEKYQKRIEELKNV